MPIKPPISTLTSKQLSQIQAHIITTHKPHTLNLLLGFLTHSTNPKNALILYNQMLGKPNSHNHFTFTHALKACSLVHTLFNKGLEIHSHVLKSGHYCDVFIQNCLIHLYVFGSDISAATRVFDSILKPDVISWTSIVSGLSKCGYQEEAIFKLTLMNVQPNSNTLVSGLSACSSLRAVKYGKSIHGYIVRTLSEANVILDNAILEFYVKNGSLETAKYLFVKMPRRDVVSWTSMVGGLAERGFSEEAITIFQEMVAKGEAKPNVATMVTVLSACSSLGSLSLGKLVHSYLSTDHNVSRDGHLGNALVNMYTKCGDMGTALEVFNILRCKDIISWSTLISGMAMNGHSLCALRFFSLMVVTGVQPDSVAFVGVLSACSHGGMVDQALMFFRAMYDVYGFVPQMEHYACMVDMYGRAGLLEEAECFIRKMPIAADGVVWGAFLNACKVHGNDEMFHRIRQGVLNSRGVSTGTLALLSNTYASSNNWDDANKVRDEMRCMRLKMTAGCSRVEIDVPA